MVCDKCGKDADNHIGLAVNGKITRGKYWCRECFVAAGGKWLNLLVATSDIEARQAQERNRRMAASELHKERRRVNEKRTLRRKVKKTAKERKNATLLITKLLRT